jgi:hypothetical protein
VSVSSLPKLDDFKKAIAAVKAANTKYTTAQNSLKPSQEAIDKAKGLLDTARDTLNSLQGDYNNKSYLNNSTYQSAYSTYQTAADKANSLESYWRSRDWLNSDSGYQNAANAYNIAKDFIDSGKYLQNNSAYQTAANNLTTAQQKLETAKNYLNSEDYLNKNSTYQNLLSARQTAENTLNQARDFYDSGRYYRDNSTYNNYVNAFNDADRKLNDLRNWKDSGRYLEENSAYKNAVNAIPSKEDALRAAENKLDNWSGARSGSAWNSAVSAKVAADTALGNAWTARDKAAEAASNAADTLIRNQDTTRSTAETNVNKTRDSLEVAANKARETAETTFNTVRENIDRTKDTLRQTAENTVNTAQSAYENLQPAVDKAKETAANAANTAKNTAETNKNIAENKADELAWGAWQNSAKAADTYNTKANDIAKGLESVANKTVETQKSAVDSQNSIYETAQNKYNDTYNEIKPDFEDYNAKVADLSNYAQTFKENIGDISNTVDAKAAKTLLDQFNAEIKGSGIQELQDKVAPLFSGIDPTANIPKLNAAFKNVNPDVFSNIDRATGMPILNQAGLDKVLNKYGDNNLNSGQYRDNYNAFGWNSRSDGSSVSRGPAILGLDMGNIQAGMQSSKGYVKSGTSTEATDADFKKAADTLELDFNSYVKPVKFVPTAGSGLTAGIIETPNARNSKEYTNPNTGETYLARIDSKGNFTNSLDKTALYNDIADRTKDFYVVANALEAPGANKPAEHAAVLFKADGAGNLVPVIDENGKASASYYKTSTVTHAGWQGQLAELAPLIQMAALVFAPQLGGMLNSAIGGIQVSAAVAPTAFTMGLPAVTLAQTIGATGVAMISGAVQNAVTSGLMGGDIGKAALSGAISPALAGNANKILENVGIGQDSIAKIAAATNLSAQQVTNLMANGLTVGVTGAVLGDPNALENALTSTAGQFAGYEAQNLVYDTLKSADPKVLAATANAAGNVANIATQTTINGGDVSLALQNAMPSILTDAAQAGNAVKPSTPPPIEERSTYPEPVPDKYEQIIDAFGNPISKGEQYGDPLAALVGSQVNGTTLSDLSTTKTTSNLPTVFPNGTVQINPNVQYGKIYETTVDGQIVQARDAIRSDGEKVTIYFDPSTGEHATTELIGSVNLSPTLGETKGNILESLTGGKVLDYANLTATKKFTLDGDPIVESPSGKYYALKEDGTNKELNTSDLSKSLKLSGKSSNGMPLLESPDGKFYVANTKTNAIEEAKINALFSFGTPPPEVTNNIALAGTGSTSTVQQDKFGFIAQDFGTPEEKLKAITDVETWEKSIQNDPKATAQEKTKAAEITKAIRDANVTATQPEVQQPVVTPPVVTPPEVKPTETKPDTTTTAGGSSTAAPTPALTPQQKADELQKQADAAQSQVMNAANNYILNPTVENKAKASAAVLDYELAAKIADAAKADLVSKPEIPLPNDGGSPTNQPTEAPSSSQQTGSQQPTQTPGSQEPAQPGTPQPAQPEVPQPSQPGLPLPPQPGADQPSQTTSTTPGSGTSNLPSTSTTAGLGGTGAGGAGTSGSGTTGTGTGTGTGVGTGTDIAGILSALAGGLGGGKVPTVAGGLSQVPAGYTAVTTPLAKRPIGDLYPVSNMMMSPEEIAARSTTKMVRRGGLVSIR